MEKGCRKGKNNAGKGKRMQKRKKRCRKGKKDAEKTEKNKIFLPIVFWIRLLIVLVNDRFLFRFELLENE